MIGRFKANNPYNHFLLFVYAVLLKLPLFLMEAPALRTAYDGVLYKYILSLTEDIAKGFPAFYGLLSFILLFVQAMMINRLAVNRKLFNRPNYLPAMSYLLITSLFIDWYAFSAILLVNTILIWVCSQLCHLYQYKSAKTAIFNIGFIISIASLIYLPAICFILLMLMAISTTRSFRLPEWIIAFIGLLTPYYFYGSWLFLTGAWKEFQFSGFYLGVPEFMQPQWGLAALIFLIAITILGIYFIQRNLRRQIVQTRKNWQIIYTYLLLSMILSFTGTEIHIGSGLILAVPLSILIAAAFLYPEKKWFPFLAHWALVAICITIYYILP